MWWCSLLYERHPKMTPGLYTVYKLRALERLMDDGGFAALRVFGGDEPLRGVLARMCRKGHRLFALGGEAPTPPENRGSLLHRLYAATPPTVRALARFAHWWWSVRRHMPPDAAKNPLPPVKGQPATIVTYFPNVDMKAAENGRYRSRYWEDLHEALNEQAATESGGSGHFVRWLFIRFPAPQLSLTQCLALRDRFRAAGRDGASFHYLEEFLRTSDLFGALLRHARLCLASLRIEKEAREAFHFAGSHINFWDYLGQYWAESFRGWRGLERCLQQRAFNRYVALAGPQRWTLFPLENCPWERMGSNVVSGAAFGLVLAVGGATLFGSLARQIAATSTPTSFDRGVNSVSWLLLRFMLAISSRSTWACCAISATASAECFITSAVSDEMRLTSSMEWLISSLVADCSSAAVAMDCTCSAVESTRPTISRNASPEVPASSVVASIMSLMPGASAMFLRISSLLGWLIISPFGEVTMTRPVLPTDISARLLVNCPMS